jgi:predicted RND superfamily exporter protein
MSWYAEFCYSHPRWIAVVLLFVTVVMGAGASQLEYDEEPRAVYRRPGREFERLERLLEDFGPDDADVLVVIEGEELFRADAIGRLQSMVQGMAALQGVKTVYSIFDMRRVGSSLIPLIPRTNFTEERLLAAKERALAHPVVAGQLLSDDARTMFVIVRLANDSSAISVVAPRLAMLRQVAAKSVAGSSLRVRFAGHPAARVEIVGVSKQEVFRYMMFCGLITASLALVMFRSITAVGITLVGPFVGTLWTAGAMGWAGAPLNGLNTVLPSLVFVIGFADAVHWVSEFRRCRWAGDDAVTAMRHTFGIVGTACFVMALTTAAGFASLAAAEMEIIRQFGIAAAAGIALSTVAVLTVTPLLAATSLGERMGRQVPSREVDSAASPQLDDDPLPMTRASRFWLPVCIRLLSRPRTVAIGSALATIGLCALGSQIRPEIRWMEMLPQHNETVQVTELCDRAVGGSLLAYVVVEWPDRYSLKSHEVHKALRAAHAVVDGHPPLRGSLSVLNLLRSFSTSEEPSRESFRALDRTPEAIVTGLVRQDLRRAVVTTHVPDIGASRLLPVFTRVDEDLALLEREHPGFHFQLTGTAVVACRNVYGIVHSLKWSMFLSGMVVFASIAVTFRSLRVGLISVIPNLFPLTVAAGVLVLLGEPLRFASAMTFGICLGLADDNTIHLLTRYRHELAAGYDVRGALKRALIVAGEPMALASVTLVGGFASLAVSQLPPIRDFALLSMLCLGAALIGDLVILPSMILCFSSRVQRSPEDVHP